MVVNLFYRDPNLLRERGFGYLIPRSVPASQNPECGLGVIFDTFCGTVPDSIPGTKLTVMLGGHYWDAFSQYPSDEEGHRMAASLLKRHLGIDVEPEVVKVTLNKNAIPQYHVGHYQRMATTHSDLLSKFNGRLSVVGSSYTGVGVNDCITAALGLSKDFSASSDERVTGLESFRI
jgi:oxygen-dependent protoporphyrinogen oxidase